MIKNLTEMRPKLPDFSRRSPDREMIDHPQALSRDEWGIVLQELRLVNRWLGGSRAVLEALKPLIEEQQAQRPGIPVRVVDFGCGSSDIGVELVRWARRAGCPMEVIAVDLDPEVCTLARQWTAGFPEITVIQADVRRPCLKLSSCELILCSAFLHHFSDAEIGEILKNLLELARKAVLMIDLHRHPLAFWGIRLLTGLFSRSPAIRHDGPLSVMRAFRRNEIESILARAGIGGAEIKWRWAFRYVAIIPHSCSPGRDLLG